MTNKMTHHHLSAEAVNDQHGPAIMLTQWEDGYSEPDTVILHPCQLRAVCEQFGIIASDPQAAKTISTLQRRMTGLRDRIDDLADWMAKHSDHKHADLSYEMTQLRALQDLAWEWCADFEEGLPEGFGEGSQPQTGRAVESDSTPANSAPLQNLHPTTKKASAPATQAALL